jgi:hypothetical protein
MQSRDYRDILTGALLIAAGLFTAIYASTHYRLGSLLEMGPGMFPTALGYILAGLGLLVVIPALFRPHPGFDKIEYRSLFAALGSMAAFALLLQPFGLVPASIVLTLSASMIGSQLSPFRAMRIAGVIVALAYVIFLILLGVRVPPFNWPF